VHHDLVVVVPGIMGSALRRGGRDVWDLTPAALKQLIRLPKALRGLALPPGIGNAEPGPDDALTPTGLVRGPRILPGLLSHLGYGGLIDELGVEEERLAYFPYDWRLSNRLSAEKLKVFVERRLAHWRETATRRYPDTDEAKVVFLCHSMGGLVTRYYLEKLGGRETARTCATIGTPHYGSAKAVRFLTGSVEGRAQRVPGVRTMVQGFSEVLAEVCTTYPSIAQLLPVYRAAVVPGRGRVALDAVDVPGLDSALVRDAISFHREIAKARQAHAASGGTGYRSLSLGGGTHPTVHGISVSAGRTAFLDAFPEPGSWVGDGTVPNISVTPEELEQTGNTMWFAHRHSALPNEKAVLLQLRMICESQSLKQTLASDDSFGIDLPDLVDGGQPITITATRADPRLELEARLVDGTGERVGSVRLLPDGAGALRGDLPAPAGLWTVEVGSTKAGITHRDAVLVAEF
jgi:hypothetical protein